MKRKRKILSVFFLAAFVFGVIGCSSKETEKSDDAISAKNIEETLNKK